MSKARNCKRSGQHVPLTSLCEQDEMRAGQNRHLRFSAVLFQRFSAFGVSACAAKHEARGLKPRWSGQDTS